MIYYLPKVKEDYILVLDTEFQKSEIIQLSCILLRKTKGDFFVKYKIINEYFSPKEKLEEDFINHTNIDYKTIKDKSKGNTLEEAINRLNLETKEILIVGHNIESDLSILKRNNINIKGATYCTHKNTRKLQRKFKKFSLEALCSKLGYEYNSHNAEEDCKASLYLFSYLQEEE